MKPILLFCIYALICLGCIIHLEPIYAIISVTIVTVLSAYMIIKDIHPNKRYIRRYMELANDLKLREWIGMPGFLCRISEDYPEWFKSDLQYRLMYLDKTNPELCGAYTTLYSTSELIQMGAGLWNGYDYESRYDFIDMVISELQNQIDRDDRRS